ncbi:MAG: ankyrin repeat domain-containing protein [Bacteroidota bacterium]
MKYLMFIYLIITLLTNDCFAQTTLCDAVKANDFVKVKELVENGANINEEAEYGHGPWSMTFPIICAVQNKNLEITKYLIEHGAFYKKDSIRIDLLALSSAYGSLDLVKYFVEKKQLPIDTTEVLKFVLISKNLDLVKYCVDSLKIKIDIDRAVFYASVKGDYLLMQYLVANYNVNPSDYNQSTTNPILICSKNSLNDLPDIKFIEYMVNAGVDINQTDINGNTSLMWFASNDRFEFVKYLVEKGANVIAKNNDGLTAINKLYRSKNNYYKIKEYLKSYGAIDTYALQDAIYMNQLDTVKKLINNGADVNTKNIYGATCLEMACGEGNLVLAKLLIENGADINQLLNYNRTALMCALSEGKNIELVSYLIEKGAKINVIDDDGKPTLFHVYNSYSNPSSKIAFIKLLVEKGADINSKKDGNSILMNAISYCDFETIKYLIDEKHMDVNEKNTTNQNDIYDYFWVCSLDVLQYLSTKKAPDFTKLFLKPGVCSDSDIVKYFLNEKKIDINVTDTLGQNVLFKIFRGSINDNQLQFYLIDNGININKQDVNNVTVLMQACDRGNFELIKYLIANSADINLTDNDNWTALDYVLEQNKSGAYDEIVDFLKSHNAVNGSNLKKKKPKYWN